MARTVDTEARDALFDDIFEAWRLDASAEPPLRSLSEAVGASPGTLLHHFGSKAELVGRMLAAARAQQVERLATWRAQHESSSRADALVALWEFVTGREFWMGWRLYLSNYAAGTREPDGPYGAFARESVTAWLDVLAPMAPQCGAAGRAWAGAVLALIRGGALDLLATGDRARVSAGITSALRALAQ